MAGKDSTFKVQTSQLSCWIFWYRRASSSVKRRVGKREFHPQASRRTVRETLASYGSC